jgi:phasin
MTKSSTSKIPAAKARVTERKTSAKVVAHKTSYKNGKTPAKVAAGMPGDTHPDAPKVAAENLPDITRDTSPKRDASRKIVAQFDELRGAQVPASMHALAEKGIAQTRELYERSKSTVKAVFESWETSLGAASQGATALNHKIIEITERNIDTCFDFATSLAGARSLSEAIELQAAYWRKQVGELSAQVEEVRALSTKVTANMAEPIRAQVRGI